MPQMGYDMQEGTIVRWLKAEGSEVHLGESVAEIETDKATVEFESYAAGVLRRILVPEGEVVPVNQPIAIVAGADEEIPDELLQAEPPADSAGQSAGPAGPEPSEPAAVAEAPETPAEAPTPAETPTLAEAEPALDDGDVRASPIARRLAQERGIDLSLVRGTGPSGRIVRDDVLGFEAGAPEPTEAEAPQPVEIEAPAPPEEPAAPAPVDLPVGIAPPEEPAALTPASVPAATAPPEEPAVPAPADVPAAPPEDGATESVPLSRMRQQIARVTVRSKQQTPHFYVSSEVDMTQAMAMRKQINADLEGQGVRVTVNDIIIKACVAALKTYPKLNAVYADDAIQMNERINVGVAIALEEGLILPAILDCGEKSIGDISRASRDLAGRAASGTLRPQEYTGATFSVSNLGMFDVSSFVAIIHPSQTAVLAIGTVAAKPVVVDDEVVVRQIMTTTLSADHRVVDGAEGARFIVEVKRHLEHPFTLLV